MPIAIAVVLLVGLAGVLLLVASSRGDAAELSDETRKRDRGAFAPSERDPDDVTAPVTGREVELAAVRARESRSSDLVLAGSSAPAPFVPPDPEQVGVSRRQFFNRSLVLMFAVGLSGFGGAVLAFLYPQGGGGFGSALRMGNVSELVAEIRANNGFLYKPEGRMWLTEYPSGAIDKAMAVYSAPELAGMTAGIVALYQKCPHLGCRVPECVTSQWFECPCHGSQYNQVGEKRGGPAPRGMDRFAMAVSGGVLTVDTGTIIQGPPIGVNTTGQEAEGPNCLSGGSH